ncbi:MAG: hypothetical protein ACLFR0_04265, partial [Alphaproteobacteria bacterium]
MTKASAKKGTEAQKPRGWPLAHYASIVGLAPQNNVAKSSNAQDIYLGKADIDPATGGIVHLETQAKADKKSGAPTDITLYFSTLQSDGKLARQKLFEIKSAPTKNGEILPQKIFCLGRKIYDADEDGLDYNIANINKVFQTVQELNGLMRPPYAFEQGEHSPRNTLRILLKNHINDIVNENLADLFEGIDEKGNFDFQYRSLFNKKAANDNALMVFPSRDFARAVIGDHSVNSLDFSVAEKTPAPKFATHTPSGVLYQATSQTRNLKTRLSQSSALQATGPSLPGIRAMNVPELHSLDIQSAQRKNPAGPQKLKSLSFMEQKADNHLTVARLLMAIQRNNYDMAKGIYPRSYSNAIKARIDHLLYDIPPPEKGETRIDIIRRQGNDNREILAGMGNQLGDNTFILHKENDKDGNLHQQGVMFDCGMTFAPKGSEYSYGAPDITADLEHFDDFFLTHHHADHVGGLIPYIDAGMFANKEYYERLAEGEFRNKTFHGTQKQILRLENDLKRHNIDPKFWPDFNELKGTGWVHLRNKETGKLFASVQYAAESIPHTARTTGYRAIFYNGNDMQFSLLKLGDMRFGKHLIEGHNSPIPAAEIIDRDFLSAGPEIILQEQRRMLEAGEISEDEMVNPGSVIGRRDILELDGTNLKKPGFGRTELEAEENEVRIKNAFHANELAIVSMMSTTDAGFERECRVAVRTNSHFSLVGANLENAGGIMNKTGVNAELLEPVDQREVQNYLDWCYEQMHGVDYGDLSVDPEWFYEDYQEASREDKERMVEGLIKSDKNSLEDIRAALFYILKQNKRSNTRYARQQQFEAMVLENRGEELMLGSIYVGRDSQTIKDMVRENKGRVRIGATGTQGTENEGEAATPKHFARRGIFNANPKNRKTAIPLKKGDYYWTIAQGAIPGNESDRHEMEMLGKESTGVPIYSAYGEGFKVYNAKNRAALKELIEESGGFMDQDMEGHPIACEMPIYPSGHGSKADARAFIDIVKPEMLTLNHTDDPEAEQEFLAMARELDIATPGEQIKNFHYFTFNPG